MDNIQFFKERKFADKINFTFDLLKYTFVPFIKSFAVIVLPLIAIYTFLLVYMQQSIFDGALNIGSMYAFMGLLLLPFAICMHTFNIIIINFHLKSYYENGFDYKISVNESWGYIKRNFWKYLGTNILVGLLVVVSTLILVLPGIYVLVSLSFVYAIIAFEGKKSGSVIGKSFDLIKGHWWSAFGFYFIIMLITYILVILINLPFQAVSVSDMLQQTQDLYSLAFNPFFQFVSNLINQTASALLQIILMIAFAVQYFSVAEAHEKRGTMDEIDQIGFSEDKEEAKSVVEDKEEDHERFMPKS